jgi:hypothetical protein
LTHGRELGVHQYGGAEGALDVRLRKHIVRPGVRVPGLGKVGVHARGVWLLALPSPPA